VKQHRAGRITRVETSEQPAPRREIYGQLNPAGIVNRVIGSEPPV